MNLNKNLDMFLQVATLLLIIRMAAPREKKQFKFSAIVLKNKKSAC